MPEICPSGFVEDIEDVVKSEADIVPSIRRNEVVPRVKRKTKAQETSGDSFLPGTQKIYLKTWGCAHNSSDSEYMAGQLAAKGYTIVGTFAFTLLLVRSFTCKEGTAEHNLTSEF